MPSASPNALTWLKRLIPVIALAVLGAVVGVGFASVINMPMVESIADFKPGQITQLYDRNGEPFASFAKERRVLLEEGEVPELIQQAVLAAEDRNFMQHGGVDAEGVVRAALRNLTSRRATAFGGSTITMQLARRLFLSPKKLWRRKIEEALLAVELEKNFSKEQILTLYCNFMFLGHGNYGMEAASRSYFGKSATDLDAAEAASLVGILQRPSEYSPYKRPDLVLNRRNYVLRRMREEAFISQETFDAALARPLKVKKTHRERQLASYFAEEVRKGVEVRHGSEAVFQRGLQISTTLDPMIQAAAEEALRRGLSALDQRKGWRGPAGHVELGDETPTLPSWISVDYSPGAWNEGIVLAVEGRSARVQIGERTYELLPAGMEWTKRGRPRSILKRGDLAWFQIPDESDSTELRLVQVPELEGAVLVLESATGAVRAMVGGWSYEDSKFNRATQAKRQVGSAFKPFVYGAALESGYTAADTFFDGPAAFPGPTNEPTYSPRNYYRDYYGIATMRRALELSMNVTAVKVLDLVGVERVIDFARRSGIESDLPPFPSLALGTADLSPLELASAYAALSNHGIHVQPYLIEHIKSPDGRILEEHTTQARKTTEPQIAFVLTNLLEGVIDRGTATLVRDFDLDLAGKTGTTDDYSDAWFVGYSPRYTMLTWVGYDLKKKIGRNMTGAAAALPIWRELVEAGLRDGWLTPGERFSEPPGLSIQEVEYFSGLVARPGAERVVQELFIQGTEPVLQYTKELEKIFTMPWYQQRAHYIAKDRERMPEDVEDWTEILEVWAE
ncbi:MAG: PBP1A family penicillin-binding protein [bacterium]|nr:PBP1A family penicillin-binding protein [bacterium]